MYPLFAKSRCILCLHMMTPTGSDVGALLENAYRRSRSSTPLYEHEHEYETDLREKIDGACSNERQNVNVNPTGDKEDKFDRTIDARNI